MRHALSEAGTVEFTEEMVQGKWCRRYGGGGRQEMSQALEESKLCR